MSAKVTLVFCLQVLMLKAISGQCIPGGPLIDDYTLSRFEPFGPFDSLACPGAIIPTSGGIFAVTSISPIAPTGITVISENSIDGFLTVIGELPFLGAVALDGSLPTVGAGGINYGCGNGNVAVLSEGLAPAGPACPANIAYRPAPGFGYGPNFAGSNIYGPDVTGFGYGCGFIY